MTTTVRFNPDHRAVLDELLLDNPFVRAGKMFGYPAYYAGKKLAICLYEDGVGIKLPEQTVNALLLSDRHAIPFQPMGKSKMREWVQIDLADSEGYRAYVDLFDESVHHVMAAQ